MGILLVQHIWLFLAHDLELPDSAFRAVKHGKRHGRRAAAGRDVFPAGLRLP
jgi:hypothetical protein